MARATWSARSPGTRTGVLAALAKRFRAQALSIISRRGNNHKPRPGSLAERSGTTLPSGATTKQLEKDTSLYDTILGEGATRELRLRFCRNVSADDVVSAFEDSLKPRILSKRKKMAGSEADKLKDLETFRKMFSLDKLKKNNELRFTWHPDGTLSTVINGKRQPDLHSPDLCWALYDVYLGAKPITKSGKKKLVRRVPEVLKKAGA